MITDLFIVRGKNRGVIDEVKALCNLENGKILDLPFVEVSADIPFAVTDDVLADGFFFLFLSTLRPKRCLWNPSTKTTADSTLLTES